MTLYADANYPVPPQIDALHADEVRSFSTVGTWGTAAQRTAVAATARKIRCAAGIQESIGDEALCEAVALPPAVKRLTEATALGGVGIDRKFCHEAQAAGLTEGAYVEIVGVVSRIVNLDIFARGIGVPSRLLHAPDDDGSPSFERPDEAADEGFYTASVPNAPAGGALADSLYGGLHAGNILRAVSLVPEEARRVIKLVGAQYFTGDRLLDFAHESDHALSRAQVELVATKVSEHNRCFY
jgi:hypothetical protein